MKNLSLFVICLFMVLLTISCENKMEKEVSRMIELTALEWFYFVPDALDKNVKINNMSLLKESRIWWMAKVDKEGNPQQGIVEH
ncbi:MAG: hypothetical protein ACE5HI_14080 [bacterium]